MLNCRLLVFCFAVFLVSSFLSSSATAQPYFPIGVWNTDFGNHIYFQNGTWHIEDNEKTLVQDLGINYVIAGTANHNTEVALINFCEENNGNIKATLERRSWDD